MNSKLTRSVISIALIAFIMISMCSACFAEGEDFVFTEEVLLPDNTVLGEVTVEMPAEALEAVSSQEFTELVDDLQNSAGEAPSEVDTDECKADIDVQITAFEEADGELTDITFEITPELTYTDGTDDYSADAGEAFSDNKADMEIFLPIGSMTDPTRIEHTTDNGSEYYYRDYEGTEASSSGSSIKTFIYNATEKVVSFFAKVLGTFEVTSDAFEVETDEGKDTYATFTDAQSAAATGATEKDPGQINVISNSVDTIKISESNLVVSGLTDSDGNPMTEVTKLTLNGENNRVENFIMLNSLGAGDDNRYATNYHLYNLKFVGRNGIRNGFANGENNVVEKCEFDNQIYAIQYDGNKGGTVLVKDCTVVGFNTFTDLDNIIFDGCTFTGIEGNSFSVVQTHSNMVIKNSSFDEKFCGNNTIYVGTCSEEGDTCIVENCTLPEGVSLTDIFGMEKNTYTFVNIEKDGDVYIRGLFLCMESVKDSLTIGDESTWTVIQEDTGYGGIYELTAPEEEVPEEEVPEKKVPVNEGAEKAEDNEVVEVTIAVREGTEIIISEKNCIITDFDNAGNWVVTVSDDLSEDQLNDLEGTLRSMLTESQMKHVIRGEDGALCRLIDQATADRYFNGNVNHLSFICDAAIVF